MVRIAVALVDASPDIFYSIGLDVDEAGMVSDVRKGSAADEALLAPGEKIVTINGSAFTLSALHAAIQSAKGSSAPISMQLQNDVTPVQAQVNYHEGEKYPALIRVEGTPGLPG